MRHLSLLPWWLGPFAAAITVGKMDIDAVSGGSTNLGVAFIQGEAGGGGGSSNQLVGIQGDCGSSWINLGLILSTGAPNGQSGGGQGMGTASAPQKTVLSRQTSSCHPTTYRFTFSGQAAHARG